jgi:hypothetical protein
MHDRDQAEAACVRIESETACLGTVGGLLVAKCNWREKAPKDDTRVAMQCV